MARKTFQYEGISPDGRAVSGIVRARDAEEAAYRLRRRLRSLSRLSERESGILSRELLPGKTDEKELALVCRQFAIILRSGMPIVRAAELVGEQTGDRQLKRILTAVGEDVAAGYPVADSFARRGPRLPGTFVETIRAGEESGALELSFERLAEYFGKRSDLQKKLVSALIYPAFVLLVALVVIGVIMLRAVPAFVEAFAAMDVALPLPTRAVIALSGFLRRYTLPILLLLLLLAGAVRLWAATDRGKMTLAELRLRLPLIGKLQYMSSATEFASTLSTMLSAGVPTIRSLTITGRALSNYAMGRSVLNMAEAVEGGFSMGEAMRRENRFPRLLREMTSMGEESGSLEETLRVVAEYYDSQVSTLSARLVSLFEPVMICLLAVFVTMILLAVYLPMFQMYNGVL